VFIHEEILTPVCMKETYCVFFCTSSCSYKFSPAKL